MASYHSFQYFKTSCNLAYCVWFKIKPERILGNSFNSCSVLVTTSSLKKISDFPFTWIASKSRCVVVSPIVKVQRIPVMFRSKANHLDLWNNSFWWELKFLSGYAVQRSPTRREISRTDWTIAGSQQCPLGEREK